MDELLNLESNRAYAVSFERTSTPSSLKSAPSPTASTLASNVMRHTEARSQWEDLMALSIARGGGTDVYVVLTEVDCLDRVFQSALNG